MATERPIIFGEVLFDRFADGSCVPGGAPFNVAWNLQAFGVEPLLVSRIGQDVLGQSLLRLMRDWGLSTAALQQDPEHPTGTVEVNLKNGEPAFEIVADRAYDFIEPVDLSGMQPGLLYHGSLATRQPVSAATLAALRASLMAPVFVDINLREPWWEHSVVMKMLQGARWIKLNQAELEQLLDQPPTPVEKARKLLQLTGAEQVILTCGAAGASLISANREPLRVRPGQPVAAVDSVGAGDAFASVMLLGQLRGWPPAVAAERAQDFAAALVGVRGATVTERSFYNNFLSRWRADESEY